EGDHVAGLLQGPNQVRKDGDLEPFLRHYKRRLMRWVRITKEFLPAGEQALRALEQLTGEAELEFEEISDDLFDNDQGIQKLIEHLEAAFGEREIFRQGGVIREFENVGRLQGESVTAFVRRFQLLERKLQDSRVPAYPEQARTVKLLDGLKLDERAITSLLLAAGNKYQMKPILEAIRIQYPPGMSVTGLPRGLATLSSRSSRSSTTRASSYKASSSASTRRSTRSARPQRWSQWNTDWQDGVLEEEPEEQEYEESPGVDQGEDADEYEPIEEPDYPEEEDDEMIPDQNDQAGAEDDNEVSALIAAAEALTVTSRKLAGLVQSRGYYQNADAKGKGKSGDKGKGKGGKLGGKSKGKGKGKPSSKGPSSKKGSGKSANSASDRQGRLRGSLCLGCGAADHWIRDCPHVTTFQAQVATADLELDPEGMPVSQSWMTQVADAESEEENTIVYEIPRPPSVLLSTCDDASFLIADTGCQRQVAGRKWHAQRQHELQLMPNRFPEVCRFSFGPHKGVPSQGRWLYPAGIAGELVMLGISEVDVDAPGLLSRPAMEALGAVPDLVEGRVTFKALGGKSAKLYLSPCRHLALKIDEWPEDECSVHAMQSCLEFGKQGPPDVVHPNAFPPERVRLEAIGNSRVAKALPDALQDQIRRSSMAVPLAGDHAAMAASSALQLSKYPRDPARCDHTGGAGTRVYGAAGVRIRICDNCGSRWALTATGEALEVVPKANPNAKTPLGLTEAQKQRVITPKSKAKAAGGPNDVPLGKSSQPSLGYSPGLLQGRASGLMAPPPPPSMTPSIPTRTTALFRMNGQRRMQQRQWHSTTPASSDTDAMSTTSRRSRGSAWGRPQYRDGTYMDQEEMDAILIAQNDDINLMEERMNRDDWEGEQFDDLPDDMRRVRKRLAGASRAMFEAWKVEQGVYEARTRQSRQLRKHKADFIELYEGDVDQFSEAAVSAGLRVIQPLRLRHLPDNFFDVLADRLRFQLPYLIVWNRGPHDEASLPAAGHLRSRMLQLVRDLFYDDVHFFIIHHGNYEFLEDPDCKQLHGLPGVQVLQVGPDTRCLSSSPCVLASLRGEGTFSTTTSAAVIEGLQLSLRADGDERWCQHHLEDEDPNLGYQAWISGMNRDDLSEDFMLMWEPPGEINYGSWFLDINRHHESWKPLLEEAEKRLRGMTSSSVTLKTSPFLEQVKALVPWDLKKVQLFRAPKQRRLPQDILLDGIQHRGDALLYNDDSIALEAEAIATIINSPTGKYGTPVRVCIYFYGNAPATSMNPEENKQPEAARKPNNEPPSSLEDQMMPHQPGYRDISFPGVYSSGSQVEVVQARRFNDRVYMDIVYVKDIRGGPHMFLNLVDDGTVYQAVTRLTSRSEEAVVTALVNGWFTYFGPPDELTIDAEGAFRGMRFETLTAQLNVSVRCVPPDSHWQLGKAERHGQALKYNSSRLIHQFAALTPAEVNVCVLMACYSKNRLIRRSGSSPNQWVFGRDPKLPASLLSDGGSVESAQLTNDSERLLQLESIRTHALMNHHRYEAHESLRASLLRKSRPFRGSFEPGQRVAYFRKSTQTGDGEGSIEGYRQGVVLALDRNPSSNVAANIWIRNSRGRIVQCSPEQCRPVAGEQEWWVPDEQDLE
ncbi:luxQ, partial [Symbiodinium microadriaticum]